METADFFRARIDAMINLNDPLAVLATRLPWSGIEASLGAKFERQERAGVLLEGRDMFGPTVELTGAGTSNAGRPKLPIRLMASLLYLKHSFNLSDEEVVVRWSESVLWQFFSGMEYYEHRLPRRFVASAASGVPTQRERACDSPARQEVLFRH